MQAFLNRWLHRLPFSLEGADPQAGYSPRLSIWPMEYSLPQGFDRLVHGRANRPMPPGAPDQGLGRKSWNVSTRPRRITT